MTSFGLVDGKSISLQVKANFGITLAVQRPASNAVTMLDVNTAFSVQEVIDMLQDDEGVDCSGMQLMHRESVLDDMKLNLKSLGIVEVESVLRLEPVPWTTDETKYIFITKAT